MPLILNGDTGISGVDGTAGTPSLQGTDSNTGVFYATDIVGIATNGTERMRIDSSGRVGIGTTSPTYTLEVATGTSGQQSLANFRTADSTAANNAGLQIFATPSATAGSRNILVSWDADGANTSGGDYFYIQKLGNSGNVELAQYSNAAMIFSTNVGTERMRITSGGSLLVGRSSSLFSNAQFETAITDNTTAISSGAGAAISIQNLSTTNNTYSTIYFTNGGGGVDSAIYGLHEVGNGTGTGRTGSLVFATANLGGGASERMRITSGGNVGIGTSSPSVRLELSCSQASSTFPIISNNTSDTATSINGIHFPMSNGSSGAQMYIRSDVSGGDYTMTIANGQNQPIRFCTSATTERMRITGAGLVGIGNSSPTYTLDVTGSIRATTYLYASGSAAGHGLYLADGSSNGLISQMSNGSASTVTYIGNQTITTSSDIRIKNNIRPTERNALELLGQWEIVDHNWNDPSDQCENNKNSRGVWTGVIAQQIQPITPWLVNKPLEDENKDGSKNLWLVDFAYSVPLLVKAIQEQQSMIEELKARIETLEAK